MKNWLLVQEGANPSSDYFVRPHLVDSGVQDCHLFTLPAKDKWREGTNLVFVRYLTPQWRRWVEQHRARLGRVVFFMDDDLFDLSAHRHLPLRYRWKLYRLAYRYQNWLKNIGAELWVSTNWLADKYQSWQPSTLAPQSPYMNCLPQKVFFYHGSASHMGEIRWLLPVVEEVLRSDPSLSFEIIGNQKIRQIFSHLSRVHVLQPMSWPAYQALVCRHERIIGLAPLLPSPFNQARSATKFFDITQARAVGIYADHPVYQDMVRHKENGLLLPMKQDLWVRAILELSSNDETRLNLLKV